MQRPLLTEVPPPTKDDPQDILDLSTYDCTKVRDISDRTNEITRILLDYAPYAVFHTGDPVGGANLISIEDLINRHTVRRYSMGRTNPAFRSPHIGLLSRLPRSRYANPILPRIWWDKHAHVANLAHWNKTDDSPQACPTCGAPVVENQEHIVRNCRPKELGQIRQTAIDKVMAMATSITATASAATASKRIRAHRKSMTAAAAKRGQPTPVFAEVKPNPPNPWGTLATQASSLVKHFLYLATNHPDGFRLWTGMLDDKLCDALCSSEESATVILQRPAQSLRLLARLVRILLDTTITVYGHRARLMARPTHQSPTAGQSTTYKHSGRRIAYPSISSFLEARIIPTGRILRQDTVHAPMVVPPPSTAPNYNTTTGPISYATAVHGGDAYNSCDNTTSACTARPPYPGCYSHTRTTIGTGILLSPSTA